MHKLSDECQYGIIIIITWSIFLTRIRISTSGIVPSAVRFLEATLLWTWLVLTYDLHIDP
jgi:hypothetical protein